MTNIAIDPEAAAANGETQPEAEVVHIDSLPPTHPVEEDKPEDVAYLEDGRVRVRFDGQSYTLRRTKLGDFKDLRTLILDAGKVENLDEQLVAVVGAVRAIFERLGDNRLPDDENTWPAFMVGQRFQLDLLLHWRDVPLAPGGKAR